MSYDKKNLKGSGANGSDDAAFLTPCDPDGNWTASASGHEYNSRFRDNSGHRRGANWNDTDTHGLVNKLADEHLEVAHQGLAGLIDGQDDQPAGKYLGGGGPVSDNASDNSPGWKGSGRKGPRYAPKTGPQTNMTGWKK